MCISLLNGNVIGFTESILFIITVILFFGDCIYHYLNKTDDWVMEIGILFGMVIMLIVFCLIFVQNHITAFWVFRVFALIILASGLKILPHVSRLMGMVIIIGLYMAMVGISAMLSMNFLLSSTSEWLEAFYRSILNLFSLPILNSGEVDANNIIEIVGRFLLCRILDAILIGALTNIISEKDRAWLKWPKKSVEG